MKPSIPDTGTVMKIDGDRAVIRMKHEGSCRGCGAAAMGLCKGGLMQELTARNTLHARVGDTVRIGLVRRVQYRGFVLAYVVPAAALALGAVAGHFLGDLAGLPALDIITAFLTLLVVSFFSFRQLKRLDAASAIEIVHIFSDPWVPGAPGSIDGTVSDHGIGC